MRAPLHLGDYLFIVSAIMCFGISGGFAVEGEDGMARFIFVFGLILFVVGLQGLT